MCSFGVGVYQFSSNLPAPINVGSTEQTKTGNLIVEGVLRLGQFTTANAPSGTDGALYFDTTENKAKIFSSVVWSDLGGGAEPGQLPTYTTAQRDALSPTEGQQIYNTTENKVQVYGSEAWMVVSAKLALAATCTLDGDCDSAHCDDGVCCLTGCDGNCNRCNVAGSLGRCTNVNSDCTGDCDVCSSGNCVAGSDSQCAICYECTGSGTAYNCTAVAANTQGNGCTATHHVCNVSGICEAPITVVCINYEYPYVVCNNVCIPPTYIGCVQGYATFDCANPSSCAQTAASCKCSKYIY